MRLQCVVALAFAVALPSAAGAGVFLERGYQTHAEEIWTWNGYASSDAGGTAYHNSAALAESMPYGFPIGSRSEVLNLSSAVVVIRGQLVPDGASISFDCLTGWYAGGAAHLEKGATGVEVRARSTYGTSAQAAAQITGTALPSRVVQWALYGGIQWAASLPAGIRDVASNVGTVAATGDGGFGTYAYNSNGTLKWHSPTEGTRLAVAPDGRVAVVADAGADVAVTMIDAAGTVLWTDTWSRSADSLEQVVKVAFAVGGELYVAGDSVDGAFSDLFVLQYSAGGRAWVQTWGATDASESLGTFEFEYGPTDSAAVYLTGGSVDAAGAGRAFLVKIAKAGVVLAEHFVSWSGDTFGNAINVTSTPSTVDIAGKTDTLTPEGIPQAGFLARFSEDLDGDGFAKVYDLAAGWDCNDGDPAINSGALEVVYDGIDNDCNPATHDDDLDFDTFPRSRDCNDLDNRSYPGAIEIAFDGIDQNCNGMADDGTALAVASWVADVPERILNLTVDDGGNIYVRTDSYGGEPRLAKHAPDGSLLWSFGPGVAGALVLPSGVSFVAQTQPSATGGFTVYVMQLDPDGGVVWQQVIGYSNYPSGSVGGMATDDAGRLRVQFGDYMGWQILGFDAQGNPLESIPLVGYPGRMTVDAATGDIYVPDTQVGVVRKYGPDGLSLVTLSVAGRGASIGIDSARGLVAVGSIYNTDARISVFTTAGALVWSATWTRAELPTATEIPSLLKFDADGNLVVAGSSGPLYSDGLHMKYDSSGTLLWAFIHRAAFVATQPYHLAMDAYGYIYAAGWAWDGMNSHDYVVKISPAGQVVWTRVLQRDSDALAFALTPNLEIFTAGEYFHYSSTGQPLVGAIIKYSQDLDLDGSVHELDCDDFNAAIHPGATENPRDGVDQNCNGMVDEDLDGDGYLGAVDCDDGNPAINPGAVEIPYDGVDQNCNGMADDDDLDHDGRPRALDCNEGDATIYSGAPEVKHDGVDQDCNGYDLTIDVTKAHCTVSTDALRVEATSARLEAAGLSVTGRGPMTWKANQAHWALTVQPASGCPASVEVCGIEGCTSLPTTLFP